MGDSVPDWEDMCGANEMATSLDSLDHLLKEKWENAELGSQITNFVALSNDDIEQGSWGNRTCSPCLKGVTVQQSFSQDEACQWQVEVSQLQPAHDIILPTGKKAFNSVPGGEDDEMVCWLQYPLVDALDKEYYQGLSGCNLPCPKEISAERTVWDLHLKPKVSETKSGGWSSDPIRISGKDVDLSPGSGDAQQSVDLLNTVLVPQVAVKLRPCVESPVNLALPSWSPSRIAASPPQNHLSGVSPQVHLLSENSTVLNFPHFSRPAALVKANLQSLGVTSVATSQSRPRQNICSTGGAFPAVCIPSLGRFDNTALSCPAKSKTYQEISQNQRSKEMESLLDQRSASTENRSLTSHHKTQESTAICTSSNVSASQECDINQPAVTYDASSEAILGSSTGGSSCSVARGERVSTVSVKRKIGEEDSLCPGGEPEDDSLDTKRTFFVRSSATKRSRAAEVHNLSERRRRDRINEKMRALQDLIPNSNKTDKASMLDEAIEYLKMLQLHVQIISMRSGISLPSMILPSGSQQLCTCFCRTDPRWDLSLRGAPCEGLGSISLTDPRQGVSTLSTPTKIMVGSSGDGQLQGSAKVDANPRHDVQVVCHASERCGW